MEMQSYRISGCPWRNGKSYYRQPIFALHKEIEDFFEYMSATPEEHRMRLDVLGRVIDVVHAEWPKARAEVFGSFSTGLYLPSGDMDLVIIGEWDRLPLHTLAQALLQKGVCNENIQVLDKATVPIVKMTDKATGIKLDISFNVNNGVRTAELIKHYANVFPMLPKLVLVLKQFLAQRNMNEVYHGGISSYSLILMVVSFLQLHPRGDLDHSTVNLGVLLMEFFEYYGKTFDYARSAIRVKDGGGLVSKDEVQNPVVGGRGPGGVLCIEDPLKSGNDVGRGSYEALRVKRSFEYAFVALKAGLVDPLAFSPARSVLGRIVRVNDDVTRYRRWVKDVYAVPRDVRPDGRSTAGDVSANGAAVSRESSDSAGSSGSDSDGGAEESTDRNAQTDNDDCRRPVARQCSRYCVRNTWNVGQIKMVNNGGRTPARAEGLPRAGPEDGHDRVDRQDDRQNAGIKRGHTDDHRPHVDESASSPKRTKRTHDATRNARRPNM